MGHLPFTLLLFYLLIILILFIILFILIIHILLILDIFLFFRSRYAHLNLLLIDGGCFFVLGENVGLELDAGDQVVLLFKLDRCLTGSSRKCGHRRKKVIFLKGEHLGKIPMHVCQLQKAISKDT